MAVWYLDGDDEITDAVARLRSATDGQVVFVVPTGSRIATGRINFRLLAREAAARDLKLAVASPDTQVRAMAVSAGVLALGSAAEAEAALERGDSPPEPTAFPAPEAPEGGADQGPSTGTAAAAATASPAKPSRRVGRKVVAGVGAVVVLAAVGVFASLQTLPTAQITLTPRTASVGPLALTIRALTSISQPDPGLRHVPAVDLAIPLSAEGSYAASGREVLEARAQGSVVFSSPEQAFDQEIAAGTRVGTVDGVAFRTVETVLLPRRSDDGPPSQVSAAIEAEEPGDSANVEAGTILVVPSLEGQGISVTNPEPTSGGLLEETPLVTQEDVDAAMADLQNRLVGALAAQLQDPESLPDGLTVFAETAAPGSVTYTPGAQELVGSSVAEFQLSGQLAAHVLAVDERAVTEMARALVLAELPEGMAVLPGGLAIETGEGVVEDGGIRFESQARADAFQVIDEDAVLERIAGLPVSEARAILEGIGASTVSVWPEFLGDLPSDPDRIRLDVQQPLTSE